MLKSDDAVHVNERLERSNEYWKSLNLLDIEPGTIPHDYFSKANYQKNEHTITMDKALINKINGITNENDLLLYLVMLTGLNIQLFKYNGNEESIIGIPTYIGEVKDSKSIKNRLLPLVNCVANESSNKQLLKDTQERLFQAYDNQYADLEMLLKKMQSGISVMDITPISISMDALHGQESIDYIINSDTNQLSICINKIDSKEYSISFYYNAQLYDEKSIRLFGERYIRVLNSIANNLDQCVQDISLLSEREEYQLLYGFNHTQTHFPKDKTVPELFENQVKKNPFNIAVQYKNNSLTYQELNENANQLARFLRNNGVKAESIVAIMLPPSIELIIAILGVLKAGGAYLPIDITLPKSRKEYMLKNSNTVTIISTDHLMEEIHTTVDFMDLPKWSFDSNSKDNLEITVTPNNLAYVIYTSGTTGNPKGVMIEHNSLINYISYCQQKYLTNGAGDFPLFTSISFDLTITSIYVPLLSGNKVHVYHNDDPYAFTKIVEDKVDMMKLTPAHLSVINDLDIDHIGITAFVVGGEELSYQLADRIFQKFNGKVEIINEYGPTEATVGCIEYRYIRKSRKEKSLPIGYPIQNTSVYILDGDLKPVPIGISGDLWIAGEGVARGYLNRPDLTSKKFVKSPFRSNERMYKTGDIARWRNDGIIEFYGRKDNQVKIRGYRIEIGEIENNLISHPEINEVVVLVKEDEENQKSLVGYYVGRSQLDTQDIRDYLEELLPYYMIPSYLFQIERMPLTRNGKVDRKALRELNLHIESEYVAPQTEAEEIFVRIWSDVLGIEKIGVHDNFFELGGDSINAIRIISKLQKHHYLLDVKDIFQSSTIRKLIAKVSVHASSVNQEEVIGEAPLIPIQKMFFEHNFTDSHHWNQSVMIHRKEGFQEDIVREVLTAITKHHDALRMVYQFDPNGVKQIIRKSTEDKLFDFQVFNYRFVEDHQREIEVCSQMIQRGLDIENGPLVNVALFQTNEGDHLLFVIHHLVIDGVSWRILLEDFTEGYHQVSQEKEIAFQKKTNSFQEWGMYLEQQAQGNLLQEELDYWAKIDQADIKLLPVDFNYSEESNKLKNNNCIEILLSQEETLKLLQNTNKAYNTEVNDILLTALGLAIHDWTSENKLMINLEGHGREMLEGDINISRTIGWFTTHYPVLLEVDKEKTLDYTIKNIKETLRHIPNKGIGYGICRYLLDEKRVNGKATPQISFNYLGQFDEKIKNDVFSLSNLSGGEPISPNAENLFDIDINGSIIERQLGFTFTYNSKKYYESTMKMVAASYKSYLLQIIEHCQKQTTTELTPSDYADQSLTLEELAELTKYYHSATIQDIYPLTPMQEGMLFHSLLDEHSTTYFEQKSFISKGNVHLDILEQSFIKLIERYEILRSVIVHENVQSPKQVILKTRKPMIHYEDLSTLSENERTAYVEKFEVADRQKGFSLSQDILIRLAVLKLNAEEYKMIWSSHHILMDGWCNGLIMKDFFTIYSYLSNGTAVQLPDTTPYVEYIKWLQKQPKNKAKQFWQQYVEGYTNQAKLPSKEKRSEAFTKERLEFTIDPKMTEALKRISKHHQVTLNNVIQTVWGILLQKNTNLDDVVFGSVVSGRNAEVEGIEEMVGLFINTVPVRVKQEVNHTFIDVVKQMQKDSLESARYDYYPLADIQSLSEVKRNLVNHIIVFQNYYVDHELMSFDHSLGFELENITYYEENNYELAAMVIPSDTLTVRFSYNSNAYDQEMVNRLKNHFIEIIQSVIQNQEIPVSQISMTTDKERKEILHDFNDTSVTYPKDKTISQLWEEQVEKHPHHIAVEYEGKQLTYQALNEKANQLARTLRQNGITANAIVGIMIDGSLEMMVGMIGILKAGGAYLPIDPTHPIDRINYMIEDAKLDVLVTTSSYANKTAFAGMIVNLADSSAYQADSTNLDINHESRDLAYVMYTSGTTGKAKGVMVSHANLINYTVAMIQKINLTSTDETALLSSYAFDLGYTTIYTALLSGITLHIASESTYKDPNKLVSFIGKHCTYVKMTPSLFSVMMQSDELDTFLQTGKLRLLILGGEPLNRNDLTHFFAKDTENKICFMNHYGPTETTIGCMATEIDRQEMIEHGVMNIIGKPLANVKAYMLDPQQNLCPIGVKGELYVSGVGVAQGYLHNRELTEAKFLDNPFEPGERMYRTGDLARFLPDGRIEFLGRIDNQVKIRGYRVELGEIEHQLRKQPQVSEATVFVKDEADEKLLVAYFVGEQELDIASIRDGMKEGLPHYMIPTYFVQVEKMPLTRNGKLNKYALPEPAEQHLVTNDYVAPRTSTERTLAVIWSEVLGIDKVGIHDNFFDLGGDSIKAIRIVSGVQKHGFKLAMNELFKNGTIHSIREQLISFESKVSQEEVIGEAPLIPIQKMFFEHNFTDSHHWNQSVMIHRKEGFQEDIVREVLTAITKHHDALRMVYQFDPNGVKQIIRKSTEDKLFDFQVFNYRSVEDHQREIEVCSQMIQRGLDIENGPLVNVALFQTNEGDHLLFVIHHLVIDGVSWRILLEDFTEGYHQVSQEKEIAFQKKTNSFRDWGIYLTEQLHGDVLLEELEYWKQIGRAKGTGLPVDKKDQGYSNKAKYYCDVYIEISKEYTEDLLKKTNKAYNTEINDILLTALGLAIHDWTAENQILLMLEGHGRETLEGDIDISRTIGWFTTHYPVLLELDKSNQIAVVIKHVKEILRHVPNKGIGYGILEYLEKDRDETFNRINSSIKFNYLGQFDENTKNGFFNMSTFSHGDSISLESERLFDIDISGMVSSHQLEFRFSYNSKKYHESTMKMVAASYKSYLLQIIEHCQKQTTTELTPSDYADQSLTLEELAELTKYYHSATIQDIYPLTPMQEGMLFHSLLDEHSTTYFEQKSFISKGNVHLDILEQSFIKLIERYEILRSVIVHENVQSPKQVILKTRKPMIHYEDLSTLSENERTAYVEKFEVADRQKGFSLSQDILIRLAVLKLNAEEYKMIWSSHHILMDGWCNGLIMKDFFTIYSYLSNGTAVQLPDTTPYVEYIKWLQKQPKNKAKQFWQQYVEGYTNQAKLPSKEKRSEAFTKERLEFTIDPKMTEALKRISKHHQVTLNNVIQTAWGILLQKNTNLDDVVFGSVVSGRNAEVEGIEEMVGLFINTVPVRVKQEVNHTFIDVVKQMQKDSLESARYDYYPLADIQSLSEVNQELVHHIIIFQNYYSDDQVYDVVEDVGFKISESNVYEQTNYDFDVMVLPKDVLEITFSYNKELYDKTSVIKFKNQFTKILQTIIETVEVEVADINILTELDSQKLLQEFNQTNADYPKDKSLHTLFEEQAEKNPHHIAVVCAGQKLTYQELNKKANQLARVLRQQGVQNEAIVGLIMDRSIDMIIGIMGILKAGGAYLPIDPTHPTDRIQTILSDAKVSLVVTSSGQARSLSLAVQAIDITVEDFYQGLSTNLDLAIDCHQLAYVIYTSGSTGTPKGVMVEHQQVTNFIYGVMHETNLGSYERILCLTTVSFDIFGLETFVPLTQGLTVVMAKEEETREGEKLAKVMTKHQVDVMQSTPTRVKMLLENDSFTDALMGIKALLVGGEELSKSLWEELQGYPFTVFNMYGPTETTIWSTVKKLESTDRITIGKPIQNTELYLMDSNRKLVPIGVHGELCIGGDGVARGYFNREALTKERFIDHPFKPGERLYRTGDLARWLPNGELEYLGRMDNQVKVRGYRIELGEIESRLISHPAIKEAVVVAREDEMNQKYLCAYIVAKDFVDKAEVRTYVKEGLPDYMVPAYYMELQTIPLTHNGKVNRKALPKPEMQYITNAYEAPQTTTQKKLVIIWQHVLGVDAIGIHDNFFDLGGHSLKATMVMGEIHKALEISVPLKEIFNRPTIQELSDYIETEGLINPYEQIKPCEEKEYYQTSSAQKRMYTVQQLDQESTAYNMPAIFELEGEVNRERMEATFRQLIERHEVLRTSYKMVEGEIAQKIMSHLDFHLRVRTVDETDKTVLVQNFIRPFSLEEAPLFRAEIMKSQGTNYLLIDMHHIISDGVSMSILVQEFAKLYNGDKLDPLRIQYKDYAEWEQHYLQSGQMKKQARYWKEQFQDEVPVLQLPYDFERPAFQRFEGDSISFTIDEATTKQLQELAKQEDVTMHMVLLSAFTIQLARYSGQEDIVVGVPIAGRPHADLQNIMGMFVNTLAMRHRPNKHKTFSEFLKEVKENSLQAYDNQNYQLEELIEQVNIKRDVSRNFLFDVVFNLNNIEYDDLEINVNNLRLKQINTENELARVDLSLTGYETSKTIALKLVYATKLFKRETIQRIVEDFLFILREYSQNIHTAIKDVQLINSEEEAYILNEKKELDSLRDLEFDF